MRDTIAGIEAALFLNGVDAVQLQADERQRSDIIRS